MSGSSRADLVDAIVVALRRLGVRIPGREWRRTMLAIMDAPVGTASTPRPGSSPPVPFDQRVANAVGIYRSNHLRYVDSDGDAELIRFHDHGIELALSGLARIATNAAAGRRAPNAGPSLSGPFSAEDLSRDFVAEIESIDTGAFAGPEHVWSPEAMDYLRRQPFGRMVDVLLGGGPTLPILYMSKLLLMLMWGLTPRFAPTGRERELMARLLAAPDHSLGPPDVFREACHLCGGDVYLALLCATNVLADRHWRADRASQPLQRKLKYIRNDAEPGGDNFSAWYHLFGAATYGFMRPRWMAHGAALSEAALALPFRGWDPQAWWPNLIGAELGLRVRERLDDRIPTIRIG